jgi:hypothetical protein
MIQTYKTHSGYCTDYRKDKKLHRTDGPARMYSNGSIWWLNGKLHRYYGSHRTDFDIWIIHNVRVK